MSHGEVHVDSRGKITTLGGVHDSWGKNESLACVRVCACCACMSALMLCACVHVCVCVCACARMCMRAQGGPTRSCLTNCIRDHI